MTAFWHLLLGHLAADFVLRKNFVERQEPLYVIWRSVIYYLVLALCSWRYLPLEWFSVRAVAFNGWLTLLFAAFVYLLINVFGLYGISNARRGLAFFFAKQFIMLNTLFIIMPVLSYDGDLLHYIYGPDLLFLLNGSLIATYGISIFLIRLSMCMDNTLDSAGFFDRRFLNMLLRLVLFLLIIIPGWSGPLFACFVILGALRTGFFKDGGRIFYLGCGLAVVFGILCRGIFHGIC